MEPRSEPPRMLSFLRCLMVLLIVAAAPAAAHVTANPRVQPAGRFVKVDFRVPNERESDTVSLRVRMPAGVEGVKIRRPAGWNYDVVREGDAVVEVRFHGGRILPPEFEEFSFTMKMPSAPGRIYFPAWQEYADGTILEWVAIPEEGKPAPEHPAPYVEVQ